MASGTIACTTSNEYIDAKMVWSYTQSLQDNKSTLTVGLYYKRNNTGYTTYGTGIFSINRKIGGSTRTYSASPTLSITERYWVKALEFTEEFEHDADGTLGTISIWVASGQISGTTLTNTEGSGNITVDPLRRAMTVDSLTCATKYFDGKMTYKYMPIADDLYCRCNISLNLDGTFIAVKSINLGKQSVSQKTGTVTLEESELSTIYNKLPSAKQGKLRFTMRAYSDSGYSTQFGDHGYKEITLTIPDTTSTQPTATMTLSPVSSLSSPFKSFYIKGRTKVAVSFTDGKGKFGADIVSYKMSVGGKSYGSPYTSGYLSTAGKVEVKGTVTDSRGYSRTYTQEITVIDYVSPQILPASGESKIICARCDKNGNLSESGTYLKIKARRSYSTVTSDGTQNNFCAIRYRYREESSNTFSDWKTILAKTTTTSDTINSSAISGVVSSTEKAYVVQVGVIDDVGNSSAIQFSLSTDFVTIDIPDDLKGRTIGIFRYAPKDGENGAYIGLPLFGGSIDSLKRGTMLTATEAAPLSLNDQKTPGCYYSPNAENSAYISDTPYSDGGFGLEVREMQSANYIRQTLYYGRTTWIRHWDSTEWSGWVRNLGTDIASSFAADFVIEEGTANGWTYKKWKSGTYEMFGYFTVTAKAAGTAYGSMYYSEQFKLPTPFRISTAVVAGTATNWFIPITGGVSNGADGEDPYENIGIRLFRPKEFAIGQDSSIRLHVTGEYK